MQRVLKGLRLYKIHDAVSKVTELRKKVMPWEGTFDFWVLLAITLVNLFAVAVGFIRLGNKSAIITVRGCENENVQLIALVFGFVEAVPGLLFLMCAPLTAPRTPHPHSTVCHSKCDLTTPPPLNQMPRQLPKCSHPGCPSNHNRNV